jgi:hypothetical protein
VLVDGALGVLGVAVVGFAPPSSAGNDSGRFTPMCTIPTLTFRPIPGGWLPAVPASVAASRRVAAGAVGAVVASRLIAALVRVDRGFGRPGFVGALIFG